MSDVELSAPEQKYFDTRGAESPPEETPATPETPVTPEAAAPAAKDPEQPPAEDDKDNPGKFVRLAALHEERERRRELTKSLEQERLSNAERNARLEERLSMLQRNLAPQEQQAPLDPLDRVARIEQWAQQREEQERQTREADQQKQSFYSAVSQKETEFAKDHPDYWEAVEYAKAARVQELQILGFGQDQITNILTNDIEGITGDALRRGQSPAEVFYNFAKHRGFAQKLPDPVKPAADDKLKNIAAGQAAGKSLSTAAGTSPAALTLANLANMPEDEFKAIALDPKQWRKLMGG